MKYENSAVHGSTSWVTEEYGIAVRDGSSAVGLMTTELIEIGLRRNPRRAQLLVSTVLGKHLAADPRVITGMGRLLGALVGRRLSGQELSVPVDWLTAARSTVDGTDPGALLEVLESAGRPAVAIGDVLTIGFAETATALGHFVADQLGSSYLHSTRREDGSVPVTAEFSEPHSHATGHLLRPDPPPMMFGTGPVVLVDDELSTGRTALNVIEALHALAPREVYLLAGLVDMRSAADDRVRAELAERLGCRIDVVSLVQGEIHVPGGVVERIAAELTDSQLVSDPGSRNSNGGSYSRLEINWPADVPTGGQHGFTSDHVEAFDVAVRDAAMQVTAVCGSADRVLVVGTEEFMYLPLRLTLELARYGSRDVAFQSTTRSPVHAIDRPGYPIRRRIDFLSNSRAQPSAGAPGGIVDCAAHDHAANNDLCGPPFNAEDRPHNHAELKTVGEAVTRHLYNATWPASSKETVMPEADLIVVVDDGLAIHGSDGVAAAAAAVVGVPVLLAVLMPLAQQELSESRRSDDFRVLDDPQSHVVQALAAVQAQR